MENVREDNRLEKEYVCVGVILKGVSLEEFIQKRILSRGEIKVQT